MLHLLPALALALVPADDFARQTLTGPELARCAGIAPVDGAFVVPAGQLVTVALDAPIAFRDAGVWWHGELGQSWIQFTDVRGAAGSLEPLEIDGDLSAFDGGPSGDALVSGLVHSYGEPNRSLELSFFGPVSLTDVTVVWIAPPAITPRDRAGLTLESSVGYPKPPVYSRSSWGAAPPKCTYSYCNTTHIGVHHSAAASQFNSTSWSQCASNVKGIQSYHQNTNGWCDVGYNYLVCVHGDIFEGRGGGDNVKGAHDSKNCGSMGVCLMGYFHAPHNQTPPFAMLDALEELGAWKCDQQGIDPLGSSYYAGLGATEKNVYGHRDVGSTACPGDLAYAKLPQIRAAIQGKLDGGGSGAGEVVMDNPDAIFFGPWATGTSASTKFGSDYRWTSTAFNNDLAVWIPNVPSAGSWQVQFWWSSGTNRNPQTFFGVHINGQTNYAWADQQQNGGKWNTMGSFTFPKGATSLVGVFGFGPPGSVVIADGMRLVKN